MKRLLVTTAVAVLTGSPSPKALYQALLESPVSGARPVVVQRGFNSKRHHVVGEVEIDFGGGRTRILYGVFPTRADAVADLADGVAGLKNVHGVSKVEKSVPGFPKPSLLVDATQNGLGVTQLTFVSGNVVSVAQLLKPKAKNGGEKVATSVAQLALRHLRSVEKNG